MNKKRLMEKLLRYIACDSESKNEKKFCELIESELQRLGFSITRDMQAGEKCGSNGWNIYAFLDGVGEPIVFSAHLDTVTPGVGICPIVNYEEDIITSSGDTILGADDKSGISAILEAVESILEEKAEHRPIEIFFFLCEELGLLGSMYADYSLVKSKEGILIDTATLGCYTKFGAAHAHLSFEIIGKAAHAGNQPELGISAVKVAGEAISTIPIGRVDEHTVMNIANVIAEGKTNIVAPYAKFDMEIRSFDDDLLAKHIADTEQILRKCCQKYGATYKMNEGVRLAALKIPDDMPLVKKLCAIYDKLGIPKSQRITFGSCDASWMNANGIATLNIGMGADNGHATNEYQRISDHQKVCMVVYELMKAV